MQDEVNEKTIARFTSRPEADHEDAQKAMKAILSKGKNSFPNRHRASKGLKKRLMKQRTRAFPFGYRGQYQSPESTAKKYGV